MPRFLRRTLLLEAGQILFTMLPNSHSVSLPLFGGIHLFIRTISFQLFFAAFVPLFFLVKNRQPGLFGQLQLKDPKKGLQLMHQGQDPQIQLSAAVFSQPLFFRHGSLQLLPVAVAASANIFFCFHGSPLKSFLRYFMKNSRSTCFMVA